MRGSLLWTLAIVVMCGSVQAQPARAAGERWHPSVVPNPYTGGDTTEPTPHQAELISVRVTSSVAVSYPHKKYRSRTRNKYHRHRNPTRNETSSESLPHSGHVAASEVVEHTEVPPELAGANIEFIKQLNAKKEAKGFTSEPHPFYLSLKKDAQNDTDDSVVEESVKVMSQLPLDSYSADSQYSDEVPIARSVPFSPSQNNYIHDYKDQSYVDQKNSPRLTTAVSFNIFHDTNKPADSYDQHTSSTTVFEVPKPVIPPQPLHFFQEAPKVYSQPAKVYSEPAKVYGEPAKVYGEPAKVYGEPAKVYGEPAKIYSEPAKFYSQPAYLHKEPAPQPQPPALPEQATTSTTEAPTTVDICTNVTAEKSHEKHEDNYEIEERLNVESYGKMHGIQENSEDCKHDNCKVGYVVEGRQYRKYRVEERTPDGYIVGEYGVVRNEDGDLRGVRYTADSEASPRLIYDALMKFLQLR